MTEKGKHNRKSEMSVSVLAVPPATKPTKSPKTKRLLDASRSCDEVSLVSHKSLHEVSSISNLDEEAASPEKRERRRSRSNSVRSSNNVRLQFRLQMQIEAVELEEATLRGTILLQETREFGGLYRYTMIPQLQMTEMPQRHAIEKQEACERAVILRQRSYIMQPDLDREVSVCSSVTAENKLYDRMLRKRRELGLNVDPNTTVAMDAAKDAHMANLAKQASEIDLAITERDLAQLSVDIAHLDEAIRTQKNKAKRQTLETERHQKMERVNKLKELLAHRSACADEDRRRMNRVANLNVDKDVLLGKKSTETARRHAAEEKRRENLEKEVDEALRRALLNEKMGDPRTHGDVVRLPSIVKIVSEDEQKSAARMRRRASSVTMSESPQPQSSRSSSKLY